jgi:hypothetical protein
MPNYDAGHYFLTVLAPIRLDSVIIDGQSQSRRHAIREVLALMPTAERTIASANKAPENPFARNTATHFARFAVLDDVVYNGRVPSNTLLARLLNQSPLAAQPIDRLSHPFLIFTADFDAADASSNALKTYLETLWATMKPELIEIFQHCVGFETVQTADQFFAYILRCQLETTMPFNDYWSAPPALRDLDIKPYLYSAGAGLVVAVLGLFIWRPWLVLLGLIILVSAAFLAYRAIANAAKQPFPKSEPPAAPSDLLTILKALPLQRAFTQLAIDLQNRPDEEIYARFAAFIAANQPEDIAVAAQPPGIIGV